MKRLILFELIILFLATTFESDSPPGWYQQTIAIGNKQITDIQFIDTLNGWAVTNWNPSFDTAYIFRTTNGGSDWIFQLRYPASFASMSMVNLNTGYIAGGDGFGRIFKTINGGVNWSLINTIGHTLQDISFVNKDTGWVSDDDATFGAGLQKTTNGGVNWFQQLPRAYKPMKLFFINKDTGWVSCNFSGIGTGRELYRTTNGGTNWSLQFTSEFAIESLFFLNSQKGWMRGGYIANTMGIAYTTNGGFTWVNAQGEVGGFDIKFVTDSIGYSGMINNKITKSTDGGKTWGYQSSPVYSNLATFMFRGDTLLGWAGTTGIVKTTDGGGTIFTGIKQIGSEIPIEYKLYQNYPNPFNAMTKLKFQISKQGYVQIKLFDVTGKQVLIIADTEMKTGVYETLVDASSFSSGIYFYSLIIDGKLIDTKKMILLK